MEVLDSRILLPNPIHLMMSTVELYFVHCICRLCIHGCIHPLVSSRSIYVWFGFRRGYLQYNRAIRRCCANQSELLIYAPPPDGILCVCVCVWLYTRLALFIFSLLSYICEVSSFQNVLSLSLPRMGPHVTRCDSTVARSATI